jgi:TRAP-type mannitol/chloroaromatic compound transport system permease small subunit
MRKLLLAVDKLSTWIGHAFAWLIVAITALVTWEVLSRKFLDAPHAWAFDTQIMFYGVLFMMAGAYTLAKNGHVRGDVLYGFFPVRLQAGIDLTLFILFFLPGVIAMVYAGWQYFGESFAIRERSTTTVEAPPLYLFKAFIPIAGAVLLLQGLVEIIRCAYALKNGVWLSRIEDVEEVDVDKLKEMVHVKDEDIAEADRIVAAKAKAKADAAGDGSAR